MPEPAGYAPTEADTCRKYVLPKLVAAGWDTAPHSFSEQRTLTDGRIVVYGNRAKRRPSRRADYLLRYTRDFTIAVVEAKASYHAAGEGLQQAKEYAGMLGLKFAYATNGSEIVEFDYTTGREHLLEAFPSPADLWSRLRASQGIGEAAAARLLEPFNLSQGKQPRYYQEIAINRAVQAVLQGRWRLLLTMATGTGKTFVAFQICWKLWHSRWNRTGTHRRPRILYLSDRNLLVDDPKDKEFAPFDKARHKIEGGAVVKSREMYFAIYQAIAEDERREGLYRQYPPDFFDLIVVDECHRGSARDESMWRQILEHFAPAYQLGMTATPLREENRDTYRYFGNPIYQYSLKQGILDGFLAPYNVHRVVTSWDAAGWRPNKDEIDRYGRAVPDREYGTPEFERLVALRARTEVIAAHLSDFLRQNGRFAKTMVFCVDQEHADEMRRSLGNQNADLVRKHPDYVCRVTADEGAIGIGHLSNFQDVEKATPVILTTSQLLTTGVNAPTCQNIVLARLVTSLPEFKQIIGRGTRVRADYGKLFFNIIDYTGSATEMFADPEFDGYPAHITEEELDREGRRLRLSERPGQEQGECIAEGEDEAEPAGEVLEPGMTGRRKYYVDGGQVEVVQHIVQELDPEGKQLRVVKYTDYTAEKVRTLYPSSAELRRLWADPAERAALVALLASKGVDLEHLAAVAGSPEADPFDLLCHVAFGVPLRSRRERAEKLRRERKEFFTRYSPQARAVLDELLEKYAEHGVGQFQIPDVFYLPPFAQLGNVAEIAGLFGGPEQLKAAVAELQTMLYAA
ncbi:MAG: DEAD/DEAH box helicase family protein [Chloroflexi bacterium]|nr:DEAD/DEAH box helicase family protein [Chloroflexota bacterium]